MLRPKAQSQSKEQTLTTESFLITDDSTLRSISGDIPQILTKLNIGLGRRRWRRLQERWNQPRVAEPVDSNWLSGAGMLHWDCCRKIEMLTGVRGEFRDILDRRQTGRVRALGAGGTGGGGSSVRCDRPAAALPAGEDSVIADILYL